MSFKVQIKEPLISVDWLVANRQASNLVILDATLDKVTWEENEFESKDQCIPNAKYFDIKNIFSDVSKELPSMMLTAEKFQEQAQLLGINTDSAIVIYDTIGIFSSPRAWWMFKSMGHENVAVLDGGLPAWIQKKLPTESYKKEPITPGNFDAKFNEEYFCDFKDVMCATLKEKVKIVDARSNDRFLGLVDEPREGLRAGHIPNSINLPYTKLLSEGKMISKKDLQAFFQKGYHDKEEVIFSCGSGITACILALGAEISGIKNLTVYDGSWTDWGSNHNLPIE